MWSVASVGALAEAILVLSELGLGEGDVAEAPQGLGDAVGEVGLDAGLGLEAIDDGLVEAAPVVGVFVGREDALGGEAVSAGRGEATAAHATTPPQLQLDAPLCLRFYHIARSVP